MNIRPTLTDYFRHVVHEVPQRVCMRYRRDSRYNDFTYGYLAESAEKAAHWLAHNKVRKGDTVALIIENRPEWAVCYFGIVLAGAVAVPIDVQSGFDDIERLLTDSQAKVVFASPFIDVHRLSRIASVDRVVAVDLDNYKDEKIENFFKILALHRDTHSLPQIDPQDTASIIYTSGTTGTPKGVVLTHRNFIENFGAIKALRIVSRNDNFLSVLPLHHTYPFMVTLILPLFTRGRITYLSTLKADTVFTCIKNDKVSIFVVTPQILKLLQKGFQEHLLSLSFVTRGLLSTATESAWLLRRLTTIQLGRMLYRRIHKRLGRQFRYFISGGAKLNPSVSRFFYKMGFTVLEGYGLSETAPVVSFTPPAAPRIGSVGRALPGVDIAVAVEEGGAGVGEIRVRGANVMEGYYRDTEATAVAIRGGWFYTGDRGYISDDGYLYITGRIKDLIVLSSGKNVSAREVEEHYGRSPAIREICVDVDESSERLRAVIVPELQFFKSTGEINVQEKIRLELAYLSDNLASYKRIRDFILVDEELPKTRLGKIKRYRVRELFWSRAARHRRAPRAGEPVAVSEAGARVLDLMRRETGVDAVAPDDLLELDLGIDSLGRVSIIAALEQAFDIDIHEREFFSLYRVHELIECVEQCLAHGKRRSGNASGSWGAVLRQQPSEAIRSRIGLTQNAAARLCAAVSGAAIRIAAGLLFRLRVLGRDRIPAERCIICPNHTSYLDGVLVYAALGNALRSSVFYMGYQKYFDAPLIRRFVHWMRVIPIDPGRNLTESMQACAYVLENDRKLCIFPEGARSVTGELIELREGVGILAKELDVRLVPAYISGAHAAWKPTALLPRPGRVTIIFGEPQTVNELVQRGYVIDRSASPYRAIVLGLRDAIIRLREAGRKQ